MKGCCSEWEAHENDIPGQCGPVATLHVCAVLSGSNPHAVHRALTITGADPCHAEALNGLLRTCRRAVVDVVARDNSAGGLLDGYWVDDGDLSESPDESSLSTGDIPGASQWLRLKCYLSPGY